MKILVGIDLFYPTLYSGGEVHHFNVARCLVKHGHSVTVIASRTAYRTEDIRQMKDEEVVEGIRILRTRHPFEFGSTAASIPALFDMYTMARGLIRNEGFDIVNPTQYRPCLALTLAARGAVPCVATLHDIYSEGKFWGLQGWKGQKYLGFPGWALEKLTLRLPYDHILTVSESTKERLRYAYPGEKISVIYNGVDLAFIDSVKADAAVPTRVIYVGSLKEFKNIGDAILAVDLARREIRDLELVVVSPGGPHEDIVRRAASERSYIKYVGKVTEAVKFKLLKSSGLLILPSSREGFGIVLVEACACGIPFLAYDIPAVAEVAAQTGGGVVVRHRDHEALASEICHLLNDRHLSHRLASEGRHAVETMFTWDRVAARQEEILISLLAKLK